jgi:succinate dehydrogenase flavin-adding protein (antitoxin of CptAB toxin-antitoxin module)
VLISSIADQSRKRGTLESDLLMSTFAEAHLREMTPSQMAQYDLFLDENDWDIYYWATQEPTPTSQETAEGAGAGPRGATTDAEGLDKKSPVARETDSGRQTGPELETDEWRQGKPRSGEWAQTVGTFKPAYRPVPARWRNSEILAMLRRHVISRSSGGIHEAEVNVSGDGLNQSVKGTGGGGELMIIEYKASANGGSLGMAFMPPVFQTDRP